MRSLWLVDAYNVLRVNLANVLPVNLASAASPGPAGDEPEPASGPSDESEPAPKAPTSWWRGDRRSLLAGLAAGLAEPEAEIFLVFDARHLERAEERLPPEGRPSGSGDDEGSDDEKKERPRVRIVFAPSADDWIVESLRRRKDEATVVRVVTADRPLANRARRLGAEIVATDRFLALCGFTRNPSPPEPGSRAAD
jgi:hypothetical protein